MSKVASYKDPSVLETDKKTNLIYGLNGTGKSTLSDYLYNIGNPCYSNCSLVGLEDEDILVYNQQFIRDYFFTPDNLKGIFTLSKENKEAEEKARSAGSEMARLELDKKKKSGLKEAYEGEHLKQKQMAENTLWEIKTKYTGGDRVLEYCLSGLMGKKESLFNHILGIEKPLMQPIKTIGDLKKEIEAVQGSAAQKYNLISQLDINAQMIESDSLFAKEIIGNENSTVSELIKRLGNSDWVKKGLGYLSKEIKEEDEPCPFCQVKTINNKLRESIYSYFDETYEADLTRIKTLLAEYETKIESVPARDHYDANVFVIDKKIEFYNLYNAVVQVLRGNIAKITEKLKTPSHDIALDSSKEAIEAFNVLIESINSAIREHNKKIDNKAATLENIKGQFWGVARWDYDQTISQYQTHKADTEKKIRDIAKTISDIDKGIRDQKTVIVEQQKKTVNIEEAIANINSGLIELGIDGFHIEKHIDSLYKIVREEKCDDAFLTLSEGEKMVISFLYFRELCKGKKTAGSQPRKKIVVIDDPISSLSHVYIFNVGRLIKNEFLNSSEFEQVFILTHSLYFFYEMTDTNHERRGRDQKLFRLVKNCDGSKILKMKYEEIQNDYHSYWHVVKDEKHPPALIANCMRNIIEYFFNFIEKKDLNNVFLKPELQATKYQAFCRYINRESHSVGQNIFDYKEFNYSDFREALKLVFTECGYKEHYDEMIK